MVGSYGVLYDRGSSSRVVGEWDMTDMLVSAKCRGFRIRCKGRAGIEDTRTKLTHILRVLSGGVCLDIGLVGVEELYHLRTNHSRQALYSNKLS